MRSGGPAPVAASLYRRAGERPAPMGGMLHASETSERALHVDASRTFAGHAAHPTFPWSAVGAGREAA